MRKPKPPRTKGPQAVPGKLLRKRKKPPPPSSQAALLGRACGGG